MERRHANDLTDLYAHTVPSPSKGTVEGGVARLPPSMCGRRRWRDAEMPLGGQQRITVHQRC